MLEEFDMELVYEYNFPDAIEHYRIKREREAIELMQRMNALETVNMEYLKEKSAEYGPAIAKLQQESQNIVVGHFHLYMS